MTGCPIGTTRVNPLDLKLEKILAASIGASLIAHNSAYMEGDVATRRFVLYQKRKHREEVSRLQETHAREVGLLKRAAEETISEIVRIIQSVAPESVALSPTVYNSEWDTRYPYKIPKWSDSSPFSSIDLYALETFVNDHADQLQVSVHLLFANEKHAAYMISRHALECVPESVILRQIAPMIGRRLLETLRSKNDKLA